jgi:alkylhydroperoxidase family enzyme
MQTPPFPLPSDDELTPGALEILNTLLPMNLFRAVAALPPVLRPFLELGGALLNGEHLTAVEREIAILRVAHLTQAGYERHQHEQLSRNLGMTDAQIDATAADRPDLDPDGLLICRATDEMTRGVRLTDATLADVRGRWGDDGATELILVVAYYNMVSRFLESRRVPLESHAVLGDTSPADLVGNGQDERF